MTDAASQLSEAAHAVTESGDATAIGAGAFANSGVGIFHLPPPPPPTWPQRVGRVPLLASAFQIRTGLREKVAAARSRDKAVVLTQVLSGGGGVGKSQLAASYADRAIHDGTDLVVWVDAATPGAILTRYAEAAKRVQAPGADGTDPEADARAFLDWAAATRQTWLIVLDDVTDPALMDDWWPSNTETGWVIATTRCRDPILTGSRRVLVDVGVFSADESAAYLSERLQGAGREGLLDEQVGSLAEELGHLPLALSHAVAYMLKYEKITCGGYLEKLREADSRLDTLMTPEFDADGYGARHGRTVALTLLLALDTAQTREPVELVDLARSALDLAAVLDSAGHPDGVWSTDAARKYLSAQRATLSHGPAGTAGLRSASAPLGAVNADQAWAAVVLLKQFGLLTYDPADGARGMRIHALTARAAREAAPPGQVPCAVRAAADALMEIWPENDAGLGLSQALRDCTGSLRRYGGRFLWSPDAHPVIFRCGDSVGNVGLAKQAAAYWEEVVTTSSQNLGPGHPTTLRARLKLAEWRGTAVDAQGAVRALMELLTDCRRWLGDDHRITLETRVQLARWRGEVGDADGAVQALGELLAEQSRILGANDRQTLHTRHELAYWRGYAGDDAGAMRLLGELIPDCQRVLGPDNPEVLQIRADLAFRQGEAGSPDVAAHTFEELVPASIRVHGADHLTTLNYRGNLARWRGDAGDPAGAVRAFEELLADSLRILGPDHQHVLNTRSDLAHYLGKAGDAGGAVRALEELVPDYLRVLGPDHWETLTNRDRHAYWLGMAGDPAGATRAYEELLHDRARVHGSDHPLTVKTRADLMYWRAEGLLNS